MLLFVLAIVSGAGLLFLVQPMIGKQLLPLLGGSPAVWNTCMVFFQVALLLGYLYAHLLTRLEDRRRQLLVHAAIVVLALLALPIGLSAGRTPPGEWPNTWLLLSLASSVGAPFFVLASASPLLQRWFSTPSPRGAADPYVLFAASNAGSMLALLGYPFFVEPSLSLPSQLGLWSWAFAAFGILVLACGGTSLRAVGGVHPHKRSAPAASIEIDARTRWRWIGLAFVPSSLMLGVTQHISTDVAITPLLWVVPLSIYLATFIVAFTARGRAVARVAESLAPWVAIAVGLLLIARLARPIGPLIAVHLAGLAILGLACHGRLAEERPPAQRLTEFYLLLALGGALGGTFNALVAPLLFDWIAEYPLAILLAVCLLRARTRPGWRRLLPTLDDVIAVLLVLCAALIGSEVAYRFGLTEPILGQVPHRIVNAVLPAAACVLFSTRKRQLIFALAALFVLPQLLTSKERVYAERTFFGVYKVDEEEPGPGGHWHHLWHGSTRHGSQNGKAPWSAQPTTYFTTSGPAGDVMRFLQHSPGPKHLAVVGLGTGTLAAYGKPGWRMTFYELDPAMVKLARNSEYFTYVRDSRAQLDFVVGDARVELEAATDRYDGIFLDAFSSDAIPVHLLTRQAVELYFSRLEPGGLLAFHITNRHLDLKIVLAGIAAEVGLTAVARHDMSVSGDELITQRKLTSLWVALARQRADLGPIATDERWTPLFPDPRRRTWTDDYSNVLGILK